MSILLRRISDLERENAHLDYMLEVLNGRIEELEAENTRLREALDFYAKGEHLGLEDWQIDQILKNDDVFAESYVETGKRAREALKA